MASQSTNLHKRHFLVCPTCKKGQATLSVHLRRVCMKNATPEAIAKVVEKAKANSLEILQTGVFFSYGHLAKIMMDSCPIDRMIEELERRHMVVTDIPPALGVAPTPSTGTTPQPSTVITTPEPPAVVETEEAESSEVGSDSSGETFQIEFNMQWKNQARKLMVEKGLYQKHSLDHPLLRDFATYLKKDLQNEHFKQEEPWITKDLHTAVQKLKVNPHLFRGSVEEAWYLTLTEKDQKKALLQFPTAERNDDTLLAKETLMFQFEFDLKEDFQGQFP